MYHRVIHAREAMRSRRLRAARPTLEGLEERMLLYSVTGDHFTYGSRITWSIMPDGTSIGGVPSNFVSTMNQKFGANNWEASIEDALAQWENVANVNFSQVSDDGAPFDSGNIQQGSSEFGDIRIGGYSQSSNVLAFTMLPPAANGGSDSGDIFFNTNEPWHIGSNYDLETVALHEVGHALGMGHSTSVSAVMYPYYGGVDQQLSSDDIAGVQSIWGPRQEDPFVQNTDNLTWTNAANVTGFMNTSSDQVYLPGLDVASSAESYWFKVTTPSNASNTFTAQVQSTNLSELSPRVQIYNASLKGLVQASATASTYGATIDATITNATPNTTYYIRVLGSNSGSSGTGAYAMTLNMGSYGIGLAPPPNTLVYAQPDQGGGSDQLTVGGAGSWLKQWFLGGESSDFSSIGLQSDPVLAASLASIIQVMASIDSSSQADISSIMEGLLQEIPSNLFDGSSSGTGPSWLSGLLGSNTASKVDAIVSGFLVDLESLIASNPALGSSPSSTSSTS